MGSPSPPDRAPSRPPTRAEIRAAVQGGAVSLPRTVAFALLAASDDPERELLLARVLENSGERPQLRSAAAIALGHILTAKAEQLLAQALRTAPSDVLPDILRSLGRIGSPAVLDRIDPHGASAVGLVAAAARFGAALITHRFGLSGHDLPVPSAEDLLAEPTGRVRPIEVVRHSTAEARAVLASLAHEPYGIDLAEESVTQLRCGTDRNTVCLNRQFVSRGSTGTLLERKALLALVALQAQEGDKHSVSYVILAAPSRTSGAIDLLAPRCSGEPALAGSARLIGDEIRFSLRSVDRPGARGFFLDGTIERGRPTITGATASVTRRPAPTPAHAVRT